MVKSQNRSSGKGDGGVKCLICNHNNAGAINLAPLSSSSWPSSPGLVGKGLDVYFILKHVLELPSEKLENYLRECELPLEDWAIVCGTCTGNYVDKCKGLFLELMEMKRRFAEARMQLIGAIKESSQGERTPLKKRRGRKKKQSGLEVICLESRQFVIQKEYGSSAVNPFIAGDLMANEKLEVQKRTTGSHDHDSSSQTTGVINVNEENNIQQESTHDQDNSVGVIKLEAAVPAEYEIITCADGESVDSGIVPVSGTFASLATSSSARVQELKQESLPSSNEFDEECRMDLDVGADAPEVPVEENSPCNSEAEDDPRDDDWDASRVSDSEDEEVTSRKPATRNSSKRASPKKSTPATKKAKTNLSSEQFNCDECSETFTTDANLRSHQTRAHSKDQEDDSLKKSNRFHCEHCDANFAKNLGYLNHLESAHGIISDLPKFACTFEGCERSFFKRSLLRDHEDMHKDPQYECTICGRAFRRRHAFSRHVRNHEAQKTRPFQCDLCPANFVRKDNLTYHVTTVHKSGKDAGTTANKKVYLERKYYKCTECDLVFGYKTGLKEHMDKMHGGYVEHLEGSGDLKCKECNHGFETSHQLRRHQIDVHKSNLFRCRECGWKTEHNVDLQNHIKSEHSDKVDWEKMTCSICQKVLSSRYRLNLHMFRCHNDNREKLTCEKCGKEYCDKAQFYNHLWKAHGIKDELRFHCSFEGCEEAFYLKSQLEDHADVHQTDVEYTCETCGKSFQQKSLLRIHMAKHNRTGAEGEKGLKPFLCDLCPGRFQKRSSLNRHVENVHRRREEDEDGGGRKIKPVEEYLRCSDCGLSFAFKRGLQKHREKIHGESFEADDDKPVVCPICGKLAATKSGLRKHIEHVHEKKHQVCCEICGQVLSNQRAMDIHKFKVHNSDQYPMLSCTVEGCEKTFKNRHSLRSHILVKHEGILAFQCDHCGKKLPSASHLKRHVLAIHINRESKPFKCELCGKGFAIKKYLRLHQKIHQPKIEPPEVL